MPRFTIDPNRLNNTIQQSGKEYNLRLLGRANSIFTTILNLLPSNYISTVQGPNYTTEIKAVAVELARIELSLEDVSSDQGFSTTRSDFLYSIVGYLLLLNGRLPPMAFDDVEFRNFLLALVRIYFQGSVPKSMSDAVSLFYTGDLKVTENFLLMRQPGSGLDLSDEFGFQIDILTGGAFPTDVFAIDSSIRILLDIIRPAHTLFRIRYIFTDTYSPNDPFGKVLDAVRYKLSAYYYEDMRSFWDGIRDKNRLGGKTNQTVTDEDHGMDF